MVMYCSRRATSFLSTYLPISRLNCSMDVYGRYSLNSRSMRGPIPGMARICASVAVLMLIGTIAAVVLAVVLAVASVAGVVDVDVVVLIEVSAAMAVVSAALSGLAVQAASANAADSDRKFVKRLIGFSRVGGGLRTDPRSRRIAYSTRSGSTVLRPASAGCL